MSGVRVPPPASIRACKRHHFSLRMRQPRPNVSPMCPRLSGVYRRRVPRSGLPADAPTSRSPSPAAIAQGRSRHEWTGSEAAARGVELARRGCDRAVEFDHVIENVPKRKPASTSSGSRAIVSCRLLLAGNRPVANDSSGRASGPGAATRAALSVVAETAASRTGSGSVAGSQKGWSEFYVFGEAAEMMIVAACLQGPTGGTPLGPRPRSSCSTRAGE